MSRLGYLCLKACLIRKPITHGLGPKAAQRATRASPWWRTTCGNRITQEMAPVVEGSAAAEAVVEEVVVEEGLEEEEGVGEAAALEIVPETGTKPMTNRRKEIEEKGRNVC